MSYPSKPKRSGHPIARIGTMSLAMAALLFYGLPLRFSPGGSVALTGCTPIIELYAKCYDGILPFDNQTGVEIDTVITLDSFQWFQSDMPSFQDTIRLERLENRDDTMGSAVPFDVDVDFDRHTLTLTPQGLLTPDTWYLVVGINLDAFGSIHYQNSAWADNTASLVRFRTESAPELLTLFSWLSNVDTGSSETEVVLAFSEPMITGEVANAVHFLDEFGTELFVDFHGFYQENPHLLYFSTPSEVTSVLLPEGLPAIGGGQTLTESSVDLMTHSMGAVSSPLEWLEMTSGDSYCWDY